MRRCWRNAGLLLCMLVVLDVFTGVVELLPKPAENPRSEGLPAESALDVFDSLVATTSLDGTTKLSDVSSRTETVVTSARQEGLRLESGYLPVPLRLAGDPANR